MKYYAVTNDPTELMHFGIKGMHWGIIRTDAQLGHPRHSGSRRPRSAAYKRAQSKLGAAMKNGIEKAKANWREYNSPERKYERQTNRALQQARKGKLKYGKLDDWQVQRITDRLAMERNARMLSNTEKTWGKKLLSSVGEGVISGVGHGVDRRMSEWISRGSTLKTDRKRAEQQEYFDARKDKRKIENARKEAEAKLEREFKQKQREDEYNDARQRAQEDKRAREIYEYGELYDKDGQLNFDSYQKRYLNGETRSQSAARQARESANAKKEQERQKRIEEKSRKREYEKAAKRIEDQQREYYKAQDEAEKERQRQGRAKLLEEASKRDAERAWKERGERLARQQKASERQIYSIDEARRERAANLKRPGYAVPDWQLETRRSGESLEDYAIRANRSRRRNRGGRT